MCSRRKSEKVQGEGGGPQKYSPNEYPLDVWIFSSSELLNRTVRPKQCCTACVYFQILLFWVQSSVVLETPEDAELLKLRVSTHKPGWETIALSM